MNGSEAYIFNLSIIPSAERNAYIEFYAGDVCSVPSDLLVVSAFQEDCAPIPGTVLGSLYERFGLLIDAAELVRPSARVGFTDNVGLSPFKRIAVVFMRRDPSSVISLGYIQSALDAIGDSLSSIFDPSWDSIVLPVLGAGSQGIPVEDVVPLLLAALPKWMTNTPSLEFVRVVAYGWKSIAFLSQEINRGLQRSTASASMLRLALSQELDALEQRRLPQILWPNLAHLHQLTANNAFPYEIAVEGRVVAERVADKLCDLNGCKLQSSDLYHKINSLREKLADPADWVISYLQLLRVIGNLGVHSPFRESLTEQDALAVLVSVQRVLDFISKSTIGPADVRTAPA